MTPVEQVPDDSDHVEPSTYGEIDALVDGEAVDKAALRAMLDDPAARDYLVDALVLRQLAREMEPNRFMAARTQRGVVSRVTRWAAAVAILVAGAGAGYVYGHRASNVSSSPASVEIMVGALPPPAPSPTRSIRFEPGVNWTSETRSH